MHWAAQYLGKPWVVGARGPDAFDCYGLLYWVYKHHYGLEIPLYADVNDRDLKRTMVLLSKAPELAEWLPIEKPIDGAAVGMSMNQLFHHVGIYLAVDGGLVLHSMDKKNVCAQPISRLRADGFRRIEFFKHKSWPTS